MSTPIKPVDIPELEALLGTAFPNAKVELNEDSAYQMIAGTVTWPGFQKMPMPERIDLVEKRVREPLGTRGLRVSFLVPLTEEDPW